MTNTKAGSGKSRLIRARRPRSRRDQCQVALRKARIFASQGQDHLAEFHINQALELGASLQDVATALDDLTPRHETFTRREAIKRAVALLGAGLLGGSGIDALAPDGESALAGGLASPSQPAGVFLTLPSDVSADGGYQVAALGRGGIAASLGQHRGATIVAGTTAYNVVQTWEGGAASTRVTAITTTGPSASFSLPVAGSTHGAPTVESATIAAARGSLLYCCHTWMRIYAGSEAPLRPDGNVSPIRFTAQPVLEVVDLDAQALVGRWLGVEVAGACRPALKVSADGAAVLLALDMPRVPPSVPRVTRFDLDGEHLSTVSAVTPEPRTAGGLASTFYHWPHPGSPLVHVAFDGVHRYSAGEPVDTFCALPIEYANNRHPPAFQGTFGPDGTAVAASGDGRIFRINLDAVTYAAATYPRQPERPPYLAYQGNRLQQVFQTAGSRIWAVDNREGIGGIWQLSPGFEPIDHLLAGSYVSNVAVDASGQFLLAQSTLDSAVYAIDPDGATTAFRTPPRANLVHRS